MSQESDVLPPAAYDPLAGTSGGYEPIQPPQTGGGSSSGETTTAEEDRNSGRSPFRIGHSVQHRFCNTFRVSTVPCDFCQKPMFLGYKCRDCKYQCHRECSEKAPASCGLPDEYVEVFRDMLTRQSSPNMASRSEPTSLRHGVVGSTGNVRQQAHNHAHGHHHHRHHHGHHAHGSTSSATVTSVDQLRVASGAGNAFTLLDSSSASSANSSAPASPALLVSAPPTAGGGNVSMPSHHVMHPVGRIDSGNHLGAHSATFFPSTSTTTAAGRVVPVQHFTFPEVPGGSFSLNDLTNDNSLLQPVVGPDGGVEGHICIEPSPLIEGDKLASLTSQHDHHHHNSSFTFTTSHQQPNSASQTIQSSSHQQADNAYRKLSSGEPGSSLNSSGRFSLASNTSTGSSISSTGSSSTGASTSINVNNNLSHHHHKTSLQYPPPSSCESALSTSPSGREHQQLTRQPLPHIQYDFSRSLVNTAPHEFSTKDQQEDNQSAVSQETVIANQDKHFKTLTVVSNAESTDSERTLVGHTDSQDSQGGSDLDPYDRWARQNSITQSEWDIPYDDLKFEEVIGTGRFGTVYKGNWYGAVAIKCLDMQNVLDAKKSLECFKQDVATFRKTRHENVVLFMGACMKPPHLAIVTSLCKGVTLYTHIHVRHDKFNLTRIILIAQQIALGMGYLHARGIVHKDLKSKNIFYENGKVIITDFGLFSLTKLCHDRR